MPTPKKLPETLTEDECTALSSQPKPRYPTGLRDLAMIRLMLNTGLRAAECLNLQVHHVDWMTGKLMVREGKGKRDRTLWVNTYRQIKRHFARRLRSLTSGSWLLWPPVTACSTAAGGAAGEGAGGAGRSRRPERRSVAFVQSLRWRTE